MQGERQTILIKADGQVLKRAWQWDGPRAGTDLPAAAAALQASSATAFAADPAAFALLSSHAVGCDGCIGGDTRVRVSEAESAAFPQTAIGAPDLHLDGWLHTRLLES